MPVLHIRTNAPLPENRTELAQLASQMIARALQKPESYVMILIEHQSHMLFAGTTDLLAYVELKSLGLSHQQTTELSRVICEFIEAEMGVHPSRTYIEFSAPERSMFGWNKATF